VTRRWKACNPVVKDQHPSFASTSRARSRPSSGGGRGSRRFTRFDPRCVRRSGVLFRKGECSASLWRSRCPRGRPALQRQPPRKPHANLPDVPRERRARTCRRGAPSTGEEHPRALLLARCRACRRARSPLGRSRSTRWPWSGHGHDRARASDTGHRAPTSAIDAKPEHTRVVTVTLPAPRLPVRRWLLGPEPAGPERGRSHTRKPRPVPKRVHGCTEASVIQARAPSS
jgi:hypothetical protein